MTDEGDCHVQYTACQQPALPQKETWTDSEGAEQNAQHLPAGLFQLRNRQADSGSGFSPFSPVSYILAKNKKTDAAIYLSREEVEIIQMFRSISPENRRLVAGFLSNHRLS